MPDWGRIHYQFDEHPKVQKCSLEAIGLWAKCNAWSRRHRSRGFVPSEVAEEYAGKTNATAQLVKSGLWDEAPGGYVYHDYEDHNPDTAKQTAEGSATWIVAQVIQGHPKAVLDRLANEVLALINEGIDRPTIEAALQKWLTKNDAPPSWLPLFVSDIVKLGVDPELEAMREAWKTGNVTPLMRYGHIFSAPDPPTSLRGVKEMRAFVLKHKREWIKGLRNDTSS